MGRISYRFGTPPGRFRQILLWLCLVCCVIFALSVVNCLISINPDEDSIVIVQPGPVEAGYYTYDGQIHFHTTYSDGSGSYNEVISVADSQGLEFIIPADHNTVKPAGEGWGRRVGNVLVIPSVEASADNGAGHFVIIGDHTPLVRSSSIPSDLVFYDSLEHDNITILAHVFHPNHNDWDNWNIGAFTGMELYNFDENWRGMLAPQRLSRLLASFAVYPFNHASINRVVSRPASQLAKFDELNRNRKVIGTGVTDAHARLDLWGDTYLRFPSYENAFSLVRTYILTEEPYSGDYMHDRVLTIGAIRNGNMFTGFPLHGDPTGFVLTAQADGVTAVMGDSLRIDSGMSAEIVCVLPDSTGTVIDVYRDGELIGSFEDSRRIVIDTDLPGAYRVEAYHVRRMLPFFTREKLLWILSNPVYLYTAQ